MAELDGGGGAAMYGCDSCGGVHLGSTLDMRKRAEVAVQVPGEECGRNPAGLPCYPISAPRRVSRQRPSSSAPSKAKVSGGGPCGPAGRQRSQTGRRPRRARMPGAALRDHSARSRRTMARSRPRASARSR